MIIAVIAALNVLNLNIVVGIINQYMLAQVLAFIPTLPAAIVVGFIAWILAKTHSNRLQRILNRTRPDENSVSKYVRPISKTR